MVVFGPLGPEFEPPHLDPRDESDPFCTCPSCGLLGNHDVEITVFRARTIPGANGEPIDVPRMEDPPDGTRRARRTCTFCEHIWHTRVDGAPA